MSDQLPALDDGNIQWRTAQSKNRVSFEIGVEKAEDAIDEAGVLAVDAKSETPQTASKDHFGIQVHWQVSNAKWNYTQGNFKTTTAIMRYSLYEYSGPKYSYLSAFTNTEHYHYHLEDETGDRYSVHTFRNGRHYLRYNSAKPAILFITE